MVNVPLSTIKLTANSIPLALFPSTYTTQGIESPFNAKNPSSLSTPLQGFQHRLERKSTCWNHRNSIVANMNSPISKRHASLVNFEQCVIVMHTASFSMNFQLQAAAKHSHNSYLQASAFKTSLLARKLHVKFFSMPKNVTMQF